MKEKGWWIGGAVFILPMVITGFLVLGSYNTIVSHEENIQEALSNIEVQYQRRTDLIPNLVNVVKGYAKHEREVLQAVTEARARVGQVNLGNNMTPEKLREFMEAQTELSAALSRLLWVVERYPDLKADKRFGQLQAQLEGTENRIAFARNQYNASVRAYNALIRRFPGNIVASMFGFQSYPYFKAEPGAESVPKVTFE